MTENEAFMTVVETKQLFIFKQTLKLDYFMFNYKILEFRRRKETSDFNSIFK